MWRRHHLVQAAVQALDHYRQLLVVLDGRIMVEDRKYFLLKCQQNNSRYTFTFSSGSSLLQQYWIQTIHRNDRVHAC